MKKTPTRVNSVEVAVESAPIFPRRTNTVRSEVLACLLAGAAQTGMDTVFNQSSTRLSAHIHALRSYGWPIVKDDLAAGTSDGRVATIAQYRLPPETIQQAYAAGAADWCRRVRKDRRELRAKAALAKRIAAVRNAARRAFHIPGQLQIEFGGCQ